MRDRTIAAVLFVAVSSMYYATASGITSSNDGSHLALLRSMVDRRTFRIQEYMEYTEGNDLSKRDDVIYSNRPPGTALMAAPFYMIGGVLPGPIHPMPTSHDQADPRLAYLMMFPALAGAASVVILYALTRSFDLSQAAALTASLIYGFGTTLWKYGGVLFSHAPSTLLVISGTALAIWMVRQGRLNQAWSFLLGLILGLAVLVEYSNALFAVIALLYLGATLGKWVLRARGGWIAALLLVLGMALPASFLLYYNTVNFGGPLTTSYRYAINYPWAVSFGTTFDTPLAQGLLGILAYGRDSVNEENQGIFLLMPALLIGLAGIWPYFNRWRREAIFTLGTFVIFLLLFAKHHTFSGFTGDARYFTPFIGLWIIPLGFALEARFASRDSAVKAAVMLLVYGLIFLSVRNMLAHIGFSFHYDLDPGLMARRASTPANWGHIFRSIFVNWQNVPLLWLVEAVVGILIYAGRPRVNGRTITESLARSAR